MLIGAYDQVTDEGIQQIQTEVSTLLVKIEKNINNNSPGENKYENLKNDIRNKVTAAINNGTIDLETKVNEDLIGGFVLEVGDQLFDTSILRDLNDIRSQFTKNEYIPLI